MDPGRSPQRVLKAHSSNEVAQFLADPRSAPRGAGLPSPVSGKTHSMPAHDGLRSDNGYGVKNARTATIEPNEQGTAGPVQMHPAWRALLQDIELMPQDQDFSFEPLARLEAVAQHGDQVGEINAFLRGHYAYYGVAGNLRCLVKVYRAVERYWHRMLRSRSWAGRRLTWAKYHQIKARTPLLPICGVAGSCSAVKHLPKSVVREIRTLRSVGTGGGRPPPVTRCAEEQSFAPTRHGHEHGGTLNRHGARLASLPALTIRRRGCYAIKHRERA